MSTMKTDVWNGHTIRFVEKEPGGWWAIAADVTTALNIKNTTDALKRIPAENRVIHTLDSNEGINTGVNRKVNVINESDSLNAILR